MDTSDAPFGSSDHAAMDEEGIVPRLSAEDLERLSAYCGPEVYSMVEDEMRLKIIERNNAMRVGRLIYSEHCIQEAIKDPAKNKKTSRSTIGKTEEFIKVKRTIHKHDGPVTSHIENKEKCLRDILGLGQFYKAAKQARVPFKVMLDVELIKMLEWLAPSEEERAAKETVGPGTHRLYNSGVKLDISIWQAEAINTTNFVKAKCKQYKYLQPLVLLIKLFLQLRNLNDTYIGGIGSYLLYCMVLSFLQLHDATCRKNVDSHNTLANMFIDFFYYWGFIRDYDQFVTTVRGFGHVYPRTLFKTSTQSAMLACESPLDPSIDIGRHAFNMRCACSAFQQAFFILRDKETVLDSRHRDDFRFERSNESILEALYDTSHPVFQHRVQSVDQLPLSCRFQYQNYPNSKDSLIDACKQLIEVTERNQEGGVFNPQKNLMEVISQKEEESPSDSTLKDVPFSIISEAITNEFYSND
eukprot:XP_001611791.1 hypothetical protein [Babesia bovis T2Bo]